jgi:hypothetical protein
MTACDLTPKALDLTFHIGTFQCHKFKQKHRLSPSAFTRTG